MTAAVLLDHVRAYAAAVRSHLADLSAEQVDDLTDGLEADLAEALEDPRGPVATGEIPIGRPWLGADDDGAHDAIIDLAQRFGPAAEYAAELRSAAGINPAQPAPRRRPLLDSLSGLHLELTGRVSTTTLPLRSSPAWRSVTGLAASLRPLWWVLRGWVLFTVALGWARVTWGVGVDQRFVPRSVGIWLVLAAFVLASVQVGRGFGRGRRWTRRTLIAINLLAVALAIPTLASLDSAIQQRLALAGYPVYINNPVPPAQQATPVNGVFVDGMQVSNLFVYDAAGDPLTQVQVFDDRGRPVRTTFDNSSQPWELPGVVGTWTFLPTQDVDGRNRWNVYPLSGLPSDQLTYPGDSPLPQPAAGATPRVPPQPFAKAPSVLTQDAPNTATAAPPTTTP